MIYRSISLCLCLSLLALGPGCAPRHKPTPVDIQCDNAIKAAQARYAAAQASLEGSQRGEIVANLITAARIEQQQAHFINCLDKARRASQLIDDNPAN